MVNFVGLIALAHVGPEINEPQQPMLSRIPSKNLNKIKKTKYQTAFKRPAQSWAMCHPPLKITQPS